jgi:hypothetical protein
MSMADDEFFAAEVKAVNRAIGKLANIGIAGIVASVSLRGMSKTAIDIIADAEDDVLEEAADGLGDPSALKGRFMCRAFLALRQAKRLAEILERAPSAGAGKR